MAVDRLPDERLQLGRRAADGQGTGRLGGGDGTAAEGGIEGLGDDGQIG